MPKQHGDKAQAFFSVSSEDTHPKAMSKILGTKFDRIIVKNTPNPSGNTKLHLLHIAIIQSKNDPSVGMEEHILNLLSRVSRLREKIKKLPKGCGASIGFRYGLEGYCGGWHFSPEYSKN